MGTTYQRLLGTSASGVIMGDHKAGGVWTEACENELGRGLGKLAYPHANPRTCPFNGVGESSKVP